MDMITLPHTSVPPKQHLDPFSHFADLTRLCNHQNPILYRAFQLVGQPWKCPCHPLKRSGPPTTLYMVPWAHAHSSPHSSAPQSASRSVHQYCSVHGRAQQTDTQIQTLTTLRHDIYVAIASTRPCNNNIMAQLRGNFTLLIFFILYPFVTIRVLYYEFNSQWDTTPSPPIT